MQFTATPAQHFSGRSLFVENPTLWASWVIYTGTHRIFFSGDTGYFDGFAEIGRAPRAVRSHVVGSGRL